MCPNEAAGASRPCGICAMLERIESGPDTIVELPRSWMILGDAQFYRGYCVLFAKRHVTEINLMPREEAHELFDEMLAAGSAIAALTRPFKLNYECLGNQEPHVHWHIFPRQAEDPMRLAPIWVRAESERKVLLEDGDRRELIAGLRREIARLMPSARFP
jgi:diadenosine tetraphosphate (Ap4A) HIT family hydrolase